MRRLAAQSPLTAFAQRARTGTPLESNCYADIDAAYDYVCKTGMCSNPADELILYGQSGAARASAGVQAVCAPDLRLACAVGSGATCYLASTRPVRAVILHSPILSGLRVLTRSRLLACFDIFPNHSRIARVHCPVFVMHGELDREVPVWHGQELLAAVPARWQYPPWWVSNAGHNDIVARQPEEYLRQLERFLLWLSASSSGTPLDVIAEDTPWAPASHGSDGFV